jgi:hypothetical protein
MICFRCGRAASVTLRIEAVVDNQRLKLTQDASENAICTYCVIELAEWLRARRSGVAQEGLLSSGVMD